MAELVIRDEQLMRRLSAIAGRERRSVEAVLDEMMTVYEAAAPRHDEGADDRLRRWRDRLYAEARRYWASVGDTTRLTLTDDELDQEFWHFDAEGIPRLKSDEGKFEFIETPSMKLARLAEETNLSFEGTYCHHR